MARQNVAAAEEAIAAISAVLQAEDHFETLQLPVTGAHPATVRRQYLRLALLIHPDKCSAKGADEAFKRLSAAFEVLHCPREQHAYLVRVFASKGKNRKP